MATGILLEKIFAKKGTRRLEIHFPRLTVTTTEEGLFALIRCLLDPSYCNYISAQYDLSFVELEFKLNGLEYKLSRNTDKNADFVLNGKHVEVIPDRWIIPNEAYYGTPDLTNQAIGEFLRERFSIERELEEIVDASRRIEEHNLTKITIQERMDHQTAIVHDLHLHEQINQLKWKWILSNRNRPGDDTYRREVEVLEPRYPYDEFHFRDALININLASMQFNIDADQRKWINRSMKAIDDDIEAYRIAGVIPFSKSWEQLEFDYKNCVEVLQCAKVQEEFYATNIPICAKYKEDFLTADAWEKEKECVTKMKTDEIPFFAELADETINLRDSAKIISRNIADNNKVILDFTPELKDHDEQVNESRLSLFNKLEMYVAHHVMAPVNEFCDTLCQILNNPMLEVANIQNNIAGLVDCMMNNAAAGRMPVFIFDQVESHDEVLFVFLQTYLASLCNVAFAETTEGAAFLQETEELRDLTDTRSEAMFVYAAYDNIDRGQQPKTAESKLLTNIQRSFAYTGALHNLLTNLQITCKKRISTKNKNCLNLKTKRIGLANNESSFAVESANLFRSLRLIEKLYVNIRNVLLDAEHLAARFIDGADILRLELNEHHQGEAHLLSKLLNLRLFRFEDQLNAYNLRTIERLKHKSSNRKKICEQLLSLQYTDSDPRIPDAMHALRNLDEIDEADMWDEDDSQIFAFCIRGQLARQTNIKNNLHDLREMWQQVLGESFDETNDKLRDRLSTISGIDFALCTSHYKNYLRRQSVPERYRQNNALTYENINGQIDQLVSQLHYPMGASATLNTVSRKLKVLVKENEILSSVIKASETILASLGDPRDALKLDALCTRLSSAIATITKDPQYSVHCYWLEHEIGGNDWTKWMLQNRMFPAVHFYAKRGEEPDPQQDEILAILLYVYSVRIHTESPILLEKLLEECDNDTIMNVYELLMTDMQDRFALIHLPDDLYKWLHSPSPTTIAHRMGQPDHAPIDGNGVEGDDGDENDVEMELGSPII